MDKKTLSLCMIVKNEAHQLEELLRQVKEVVDEIVIVDTGSEDGTLEIAKHYTSLVFHFPWQNDFSAARNFALDRARGDYFLWLDADDRLPEESVKKIAALKDYFDGEKFFSFILEDLKGGSVQSRCYQVRCAPLRRNIRFRYKVHEELISSLREAGCREVNTNIVIRHHGYQDPDTLREKMKRNLRLLLEDFAIRKDDVNYTLSLANSYLYFEQYERASGILNDYLRSENAHGCPRRALIEIYSLLAYIEILKGNRSDALRWLVKAEAIGVEGKIEWYRLGCAYESLGELTRAIRAFDQTLRAPYILGSLPTIPEVSEWEVSLRRSVTFYRMGKFLEAREALKEAIKFGTGVKEAVTWLFQHLLCLKEYGLVERLVIEEEISKIISYWESHFYRGLCLLFKNYPEIALKHFYIALRESSLRKEVQRAIAVSFFTLERYNRAIRLYRNLILEGLKEKDIIMGGLLSSVMLNGHLMDTFVKAIPKGDKELVENPTNFRALANSIDPLLKSLITKREDRLTMLFSKLIVDSFQNNTNKTKKTTKVYSGYIRY